MGLENISNIWPSNTTRESLWGLHKEDLAKALSDIDQYEEAISNIEDDFSRNVAFEFVNKWYSYKQAYEMALKIN